MEQQVDLDSGTRRGGARDEVRTKDSLDESSDMDELGDDELEPAVTDSEDEAALIPSPVGLTCRLKQWLTPACGPVNPCWNCPTSPLRASRRASPFQTWKASP